MFIMVKEQMVFFKCPINWQCIWRGGTGFYSIGCGGAGSEVDVGPGYLGGPAAVYLYF